MWRDMIETVFSHTTTSCVVVTVVYFGSSENTKKTRLWKHVQCPDCAWDKSIFETVAELLQEASASTFTNLKVKMLKPRQVLNWETPWQNYRVSLAILDHTVLLAIRHMRTHPTVTQATKAATRFTYPRGMEGWVNLGDLIVPQLGVEPVTALIESLTP